MKGTIGSIQGIPDAWSAMDIALDERRHKETWGLGFKDGTGQWHFKATPWVFGHLT